MLMLILQLRYLVIGVKLKLNYIKHNTTVAFPSVIFLKNKLLDIPYKITSKNNPDVIEGTLIVKS